MVASSVVSPVAQHTTRTLACSVPLATSGMSTATIACARVDVRADLTPQNNCPCMQLLGYIQVRCASQGPRAPILLPTYLNVNLGRQAD